MIYIRKMQQAGIRCGNINPWCFQSNSCIVVPTPETIDTSCSMYNISSGFKSVWKCDNVPIVYRVIYSYTFIYCWVVFAAFSSMPNAFSSQNPNRYFSPAYFSYIITRMKLARWRTYKKKNKNKNKKPYCARTIGKVGF